MSALTSIVPKTPQEALFTAEELSQYRKLETEIEHSIPSPESFISPFYNLSVQEIYSNASSPNDRLTSVAQKITSLFEQRKKLIQSACQRVGSEEAVYQMVFSLANEEEWRANLCKELETRKENLQNAFALLRKATIPSLEGDKRGFRKEIPESIFSMAIGFAKGQETRCTGKIARGGFAKIYKFIGPDEKIYVVKEYLPPAPNLMDPYKASKAEAFFLSQLPLQGFARLLYRQDLQLIFEYAQGGSLGSLLRKILKTNPSRQDLYKIFKPYVWQFLQSIKTLHETGMVHRDLTPENILLHQGKTWLSDFNLCAWANHEKKSVGVPGYRSPEMFDDSINKIMPSSDIWSLGMILCELFSGKKPTDAYRSKINAVCLLKEVHKNLPSPPLSSLFPNPTEEDSSAMALIGQMLLFDPSKRPTIQEICASNFFKDCAKTANNALAPSTNSSSTSSASSTVAKSTSSTSSALQAPSLPPPSSSNNDSFSDSSQDFSDSSQEQSSHKRVKTAATSEPAA